MYKLSIVNEVNGRTFGSKWESQSEKNEYLDKQIAKQSWGKNERTLKRVDVPAELEARIIDEFTQEHINTDMDGKEVIELIEYVTVKADYVVTVKNLNLSKTYRNEKKIESRKSEYPSLEEILHVLMDKGLASPEMTVLQGKRAAIKLKYPLES